MLGFESPVPQLSVALDLCRGGVAEPRASSEWRSAFLRAPYLRDTLVAIGVLSETFETAITWERLPAFVETVKGTVREALGPEGSRHLPPHARVSGRRGALLHRARAGRARRRDRALAGDQGRRRGRRARRRRDDHPPPRGRPRPPPLVRRQRPEPFAAALRAAKAALDPRGLLNPGVLFDAR